MPVPDAASLRDVPLPRDACPHCGFLGVRAPEADDGATVAGSGALLSQRVCPRCEYEGIPRTFAQREEYRDFLHDLNEAVSAT